MKGDTMKKKSVVPSGSGIACYVNVFKHEKFDAAVKQVLTVLKEAQRLRPNCPRFLYVDIQGHRNRQGGFDPDMYEFQVNFLLPVLGKHFTEIHMPLGGTRPKGPQDNDIPDEIRINEKEA